MSDINSRIGRVCDDYAQAVFDQDVTTFLGLYEAEARVFDTWGVWSYEGVLSRRKVVEDWFSSLGEERVRVTFDRRQIEVGADLATLSARATYVALAATGQELRGMQNRLTWVLNPRGEAWLIIHEHTSVPIGFADLKGILARD